MFEIVPTRAQFLKGDEPTFTVRDSTSSSLTLSLMRENQVIWHGVKKVDDTRLIRIHTHLPDNSGYLLKAVDQAGHVAQTAFDISTGQVRYGFLADFPPEHVQDDTSVEWLNKLHINYVQFYDWAYRHDQFLGPEDEYTDEMGKEISRQTVRHLIHACNQYGINAMAYGAIYGSSNSYAQDHPAWRLYNKTGEPIPFFNLLSIMNVDRNRGWHDHILAEYQKALNIGFDGIHMDTYGSPKQGYDDHGCKVDLARNFQQLVNDAKTLLHTPHGTPKLIFNNVNNWPVDYLASTHQDGLYIEVWDPYSTYRDILRLIEHARSISNLPVILAAYLPQFKEGGGEQAYNSLALLTAIITVAGATHLVNGQNRGILTEAYYSHYFTADQQHSRRIVSYYDYITYLSGLWADRHLRLVPLAVGRKGGRTLIASINELSDMPEPGRLWIRARQSSNLVFINFVNLTGSHDPKWTHGQEIQETKPFTLKVRTDKPIKSVTYSTPDGEKGIEVKQLPSTPIKQGEALYVSIQIPSIRIWGTLLIRK